MTMTMAVVFGLGCATTQATSTEPPKAEEKAGCGGCEGKNKNPAATKDCEGECDCCPGEKVEATPAPGT